MIDEVIKELRDKLKQIVKNNKTSSLLLSGGLDTSIIAACNSEIVGITICLRNYGEDINYASKLARFLNIKHYYRSIKIEEAISAINEVIKILKTFDPAIPNDLVVYFGLKFAKKLGIKKVMTGDGADELFGGYSYMEDIKDLDDYIKRLSSSMKFSANEIGRFLGIEVIQPFCDKEIIDFALKLPQGLKIKKENNKTYGKWILRKSFENLLPPEFIWQDKRPLEVGSGMTKLRKIINSKIKDEEFKEKSKWYNIKFINKEHLFYYEIYKDMVGEIPKPKDNEKECPFCKGGMNKSSFHCSICGGVISNNKI